MRKNEIKFPRVSNAVFWLKSGKVVRIYPNTKMKRLYAKLRSGNYLKTYFKIEYGKRQTDKGELMFYNDYEGTDPKEAIQAIQAFLE